MTPHPVHNTSRNEGEIIYQLTAWHGTGIRCTGIRCTGIRCRYDKPEWRTDHISTHWMKWYWYYMRLIFSIISYGDVLRTSSLPSSCLCILPATTVSTTPHCLYLHTWAWISDFHDSFQLVWWRVTDACALRSDTMKLAHIIQL